MIEENTPVEPPALHDVRADENRNPTEPVLIEEVDVTLAQSVMTMRC